MFRTLLVSLSEPRLLTAGPEAAGDKGERFTARPGEAPAGKRQAWFWAKTRSLPLQPLNGLQTGCPDATQLNEGAFPLHSQPPWLRDHLSLELTALTPQAGRAWVWLRVSGQRVEQQGKKRVSPISCSPLGEA